VGVRVAVGLAVEVLVGVAVGVRVEVRVGVFEGVGVIDVPRVPVTLRE
jgi:hypothetical protein